MEGISNVTIEEFIEVGNDNFQRNFVGIFSPDRVTPILNFLKIMKTKGGYYLLSSILNN